MSQPMQTLSPEDSAKVLGRLLPALRELRDGNFRRRLVASGPGAEVAEVYNELAERNQRLLTVLHRVNTAVARGEWPIEAADFAEAQGGWAEAAGTINAIGDDLVVQLRDIAQVAKAVARGDLTRQITVDAVGEMRELKDTINGMVDQLSAFVGEVSRVSREVASEGRLGGQAKVPGAQGVWRDLVESVNFMADNLTVQVRNIAQVATAVARGDLTQKIEVDARGEIFELKNTINTMVDQLSGFAAEVTRVAREVGTEGKLGGQARVHGVAGTWQDLTDNVNIMADNLTGQVRNIAQVTTAVAQGDLSKKIDVEARGEILELKNTINTMVDQLSAFAAEVTRVAREVGTEGKLGGQAEVADVSGTWRRLTESVNRLAGNLTTQVRAIAQVATAVTEGDLTRQITVDASGEVAELKDNINAMIGNLKETTRANQEQDWLKTNLARLSSLMKGQHDLAALARLIMSELAPLVSAQAGAFYLTRTAADGRPVLELAAGYAQAVGAEPMSFEIGESLVGQAAADHRTILVEDAPADYLRISSGIGSSHPKHLVILPVLFEGEVLGVIELATFGHFTPVHLDLLERLRETIGVEANTIIVNSRTESLLAESQHLTRELRARSEQLQQQQSELQHSNTELEDKAALLATRNRDIEMKNIEIEQARQELEERARQLSDASAYKSEFLANMSHELRTPLNSILILAKLLADNMEGNLTEQQVELANTVHKAGSDLLQLINDVLDLSKVEAGKMHLLPEDVEIADLAGHVESLYRPMAADKGLNFDVVVSPSLPASLRTDRNRLEQILRNLLSNAIKFTDTGTVELRIRPAQVTEVQLPHLREARQRVVFAVRDTGIGIPTDKLSLVFEAFQQVDGTTVREYGGTGLGLSISRELSTLLGGELQVQSDPGQGSTFSLFLPVEPAAVDEEDAFAPVEREHAPLPRQPTDAETHLDVAVEGIDPPMRLGEHEPDEPHAPVGQAVRFNGEKVLVVDDDERGLHAMRTLLEHHGLSVVEAGNAHDGIKALQEQRDIVIVLMDVMMPQMDGNEAIRRIREMPRYRDLAIIAVTAKAMKGDREASIAAGATDYLTKPVDADRLLDLLSLYLPAGLSAES